MSETRRFRLLKRFRLTRGSEYQRVYKQGRRARSAHFTVFFSANQLPFSRFGLTVSRKIGTAVCRNRVKRIFREALRFHGEEALPGFDFVFNPHPSASTLKTPDLAKDVAELFSHLKVKYGASTGAARD